MPRTFNDTMAVFADAQQERLVFEADWRNISDLILPGRGVLQTYSRPRYRKTVTKTINTIAEDAMLVLTSGMHGGLTSPSRPWFNLEWIDAKLNDLQPLKFWIQHATRDLHKYLHASNFYSIINSFYIELVAFGNGCIYIGEDSNKLSVASERAPFRFELLTAGEYYIIRDHLGNVDTFFRLMFRSARQIYNQYGSRSPENIVRRVSANEPGIDKIEITLIETIYKSVFMKKPYTRDVYIYPDNMKQGNIDQSPLQRDGFYECPIISATWDNIGSDQYGIGPGAKVIPDVKRLQEMESALLMGLHKQVNPPTIAPSRMRGTLNTLPGGQTWGTGSALDQVKALYNVQFEHRGVEETIARIEKRIEKKFFNDIFLTGARNPDASPYKAAEISVREQEKMLRLGPTIERLHFGVFMPLITRCFNIATRQQLFDPLPPDLAKMVSGYKISIISPMATAMRAVALQGINTFLTGIGQIAQFDQSALDRINVDNVIDQYADISGAPLEIVRPIADATKIRQQRAEAAKQQQDAANQAAAATTASSITAEQANALKARAEAGNTMIEGQQLASGVPQ